MRLGGPIFTPYSDPQSWTLAVRAAGYSAAFCPVDEDADVAIIRGYETAAREADIIIAEVGAWSNPLSPDPAISGPALEHCQRQLALADEIGACCCVNIVGSRGAKWDGPSAEDLMPETFDLIVEVTRAIIDAVKPTRSFWTLETMPWMLPDSADSYLALVQAIDRERCAVHFDPVNLVNCPRRYFFTGDLLRECFAKLGPQMKSCHAKDIRLADNLTTHLDEVRPGTGNLDYTVFLSEAAKLQPDLPIMLEHLPNEDEYTAAAEYVKGVGEAAGLEWK